MDFKQQNELVRRMDNVQRDGTSFGRAIQSSDLHYHIIAGTDGRMWCVTPKCKKQAI